MRRRGQRDLVVLVRNELVRKAERVNIVETIACGVLVQQKDAIARVLYDFWRAAFVVEAIDRVLLICDVVATAELLYALIFVAPAAPEDRLHALLVEA